MKKSIILLLLISLLSFTMFSCSDYVPDNGGDDDDDDDFTTTYTLEVNVTDMNGYVEVYPDKSEYDDGEEVTLTAYPYNGCEFCEWSGDAYGSSETETIYMYSDKEVTANIIEIMDDCHLNGTYKGDCFVEKEQNSNDEDFVFKSGVKEISQELFETIPLAEKLDVDIPSKSKGVSDNSYYFPPAGSQGYQGSCVGWATAYAMKTYQEKVEESWGLTYSSCSGCYRDYDHIFSPAFVYNQINGGEDNGSSIYDALTLLRDTGCCVWNYMPYDDGDYTTQPSTAANTNAGKYKISSFSRINNTYYSFTQGEIDSIKTYISQGYPIVISVTVYEGFQDSSSTYYYEDTGEYVWWTTDNQGDEAGGHAMLITGYDDDYGFKVINSWGSNWGNNGYIWIDFDFFRDTIGNAAYVVYDGNNQ